MVFTNYCGGETLVYPSDTFPYSHSKSWRAPIAFRCIKMQLRPRQVCLRTAIKPARRASPRAGKFPLGIFLGLPRRALADAYARLDYDCKKKSTSIWSADADQGGPTASFHLFIIINYGSGRHLFARRPSFFLSVKLVFVEKDRIERNSSMMIKQEKRR